MPIWRHGDLLIKTVSSIPAGAKQSASKTLAEGEVTGHHHTFTAGQVVVFDAPAKNAENAVKYFEVKKGEASLTHQEHKELKFPVGTYSLAIEREYNPTDKVVRKVLD